MNYSPYQIPIHNIECQLAEAYAAERQLHKNEAIVVDQYNQALHLVQVSTGRYQLGTYMINSRLMIKYRLSLTAIIKAIEEKKAAISTLQHQLQQAKSEQEQWLNQYGHDLAPQVIEPTHYFDVEE